MLKFGVNYVPSHNWFHSWANPDFSKTDEDFAAIASIGLDHIRMHLHWPLFQPDANFVAPWMIERLVKTLDLAHKHNLKVCVTVLNGWMSGLWLLPPFTVRRHIFTDRVVIDAQKLLFSEIARAAASHPALFAVDIGNEINMFYWHKEFSFADGDKWLKEILTHCQKEFKGKFTVAGVDHQPWLKDAQFLRPTLAQYGDITTLHTWAFFMRALEYEPTSAEVLCLPEFNIELANAFAADSSRPVWIQEVGMTEPWMKAELHEGYMRNTMLNAARSQNLFGFTWWCSHDIDPKFKDFADIEYTLGLFDINNKPKNGALYMQQCIKDIKAGAAAPQLKNNGTAIIIDDIVAEPFDGWRYGRKFADLVRDGVHAKFVLKSRLEEKDYIKERAIKETVSL